MNIMVYDIHADSGGAATILEYYYNKHKADKNNHYYYFLSVYDLKNTDNITVVNVPWIKKSWFHRLYFDYIGVRKYLKKFKIDEVLSLQNIKVPCFHGKQTVYIHNVLPFSDYKYSFLEDRKMWIYQNIIIKFIKSSIVKADIIIVQTEWMKEVLIKKVPSAKNKINVNFPVVSTLEGYKYEKKENIFFFPANPSPFKNHVLIQEACFKLKESGITDYSVVFTLKGNETPKIQMIHDTMMKNNINVKWLGEIPKHEVYEWYSKSALIFPSYIEIMACPIPEAMTVGCPIYLADCTYSHYLANDYHSARYFQYNDAKMLFHYMQEYISGKD